jgi:hypothetical protein
MISALKRFLLAAAASLGFSATGTVIAPGRLQ